MTRDVLNVVNTQKLLSEAEYMKFVQSSHTKALRDFTVSSPPTIQSLSELFGENWLGETLLDARIEVFAQELNHTTPGLIRFLPCWFHVELSNSYRERRASSEITLYWNEILANPPVIIAFLVNKDGDHWAPTAISMCI